MMKSCDRPPNKHRKGQQQSGHRGAKQRRPVSQVQQSQSRHLHEQGGRHSHRQDLRQQALPAAPPTPPTPIPTPPPLHHPTPHLPISQTPQPVSPLHQPQPNQPTRSPRLVKQSRKHFILPRKPLRLRTTAIKTLTAQFHRLSSDTSGRVEGVKPQPHAKPPQILTMIDQLPYKQHPQERERVNSLIKGGFNRIQDVSGIRYFGMKKAGRHIDTALMRNSVNEKLQTFSHKRLIKDLEEIEKERIPTVGVTARPLETDLFIWHANIKGPEKTPYDGGVFHLELKFPQSYPNHPPSIRIFNKIPHPNVFGDFICLDMIQQYEGVRAEEGGGWSSAYSVQSVLTQLQSFLFEEILTGDKAKTDMEIKKAVKDANSFKCNVCKHGGKLSCWPTFSPKEQVISEFQILQEENDLIRKELICFHTKLGYLQNQLGLGLSISKIPRTGLIKEGETYFDYISIKAFIKESMNLTSTNQKISHWLPVYFGEGDNEDRFFHFLKKSLSMIMTNSTKNFKPEYVLEVFPKLFITLVFHIMDEKKHPSIRIIRILTHIHSMFLYCLKRFPELADKVVDTLKRFLSEEEARHKNSTPNLGCILAILSATDSFKFKEVAEQYFLEQLDRQVFWILKAVPELISESLEEQADKKRTEIVFKSQMTSFHIFCFYKLFITEICEKRASKAHFLSEYEANLCKLTNKEETDFQKAVFQIPKKVVNFQEFFKFLGLKERSEEEVKVLLKTAIKNSERKEYHNKFDVLKMEEALTCERKKTSQNKVDLVPKLPSSEEQFRKLSANIPNYNKFIQVTTTPVKEGEKKSEFKFDYKEEINQESDWRDMCITRWSWIKEAMLADPTLSSHDISLKALEHTKKGVSKTEDRVTKIINDKYKNSHLNYDEPKINIPEIDWKRLFLRLDLQDFLKYIDMNPDFGTFYQKLFVCSQNNINTILIPMVEVNNLKSGYYYITALLSKLTTLKYIEFSGLPQINNKMSEKAAKAIKKGLTNFHNEKGRFDIISFSNIIVDQDFSEYLFGYLSETDSLTSLRFSKTNILSHGNAMKVLSNILVNLKDIQEVQLIKCSLDQEKCKILADALMRMKKLRIFRLNTQKGLGQGLASIIYNLSFSPQLTMLDLGDIVISANKGVNNDINQTVISLCKLLKISTSIEVLKLNNVNGLNTIIHKDFWSALGDCKSLRVLDISKSGDLSSKIRDLGTAVAFNAKRKGSLAYLNLTGTISSSATINNLYWGMNISEYDEEQWYGDPNKLAKMIAGNYQKSFYNNLKALQFDNCSNLNPNFVLAHYQKLVNKKQPEFVKILADSPNLTTLHIRSTTLQKNMADILVLALDERRLTFKCQLKVLDLSKNNLDKEGLKMLAEVLPYNNVIEVLDLSKNNMGVSGADELAKSLKNNTSLKYLNVFNNKIGYDGAKSIAENIIANHPRLEFLELGHNRIRDKGLASIIDALKGNSKSALKILGLRFNFLTNSGVLQNFENIISSKNSLEEVFIRNNLVNDEGIYKLKELHKQSESKLSVDLLERVKYLDQELVDRTVWIHPINQINLGSLKKFFEITHPCGIILDFRVRNGRKYPNKSGDNKFCFVEFADAASVTEALSLASKKLTEIGGKRFRVYKAGTGTFLYSKKTAKQTKLEQAKHLLPALPFPTTITPVAEAPSEPRQMRRGRREEW